MLRFQSQSKIGLLVVGLSLLFASGCEKKPPKIQGILEIKPELTDKIQPTAVLYVMARKEGNPSGPPAVVKRFTQPFVFPIEFNLTEKDSMLPSTEFQGGFVVNARIAQKGSATPIQPGDLESTSESGQVSHGSEKLRITLDRIR